jgi:hypothetical protein
MNRAKSSRRHGAATMVWLFFANLFEPAKVAATEQIETQRRIGPEATRATAPIDPHG